MKRSTRAIKLNFLRKSQMETFQKNYSNSSNKGRRSDEIKITENDDFQSQSTSSTSTSTTNTLQKEYSSIENVHTSQFTFTKLIFIEKNLFFTTITMFFFGFLLVEVENDKNHKQIEDTLLLLMSLAALLQVLLIVCRKVLVLQLKIDQKQLYHYGNRSVWCLSPGMRALLSSRQDLLMTGVQILVALIHPNVWFQDVYYTIYDEQLHMELLQSVNDLLGVLMLLKLYMIIRSLVNLTKFVSPRVIRVCSMNQVDYTIMYSIKCIQKEYPIRFILIAVSLFLVLFGYGFRLSEGTISAYNKVPSYGFDKLQNCFWFACETMYTIGYGDYIPRTIIARALATCLSALGTCVSSMLMVSMFDYLSMSNQQEKSLMLTHRVNSRNQLQKHASKAIADYTQIVSLLKKNKTKGTRSQLIKQYFSKIKGHMDQAKHHRQIIKNLVPENDKTETMILDFMRVRQSFSAICQNQLKVQTLFESDRLKDIDVKRSIGQHFRSFITKSLHSTPKGTVQEP